ncbi:unnamed protein product [Somion occarium]|uniref:intramembrane prenyl-peptidase Rce1 n=1 Tax=Somion occarium TaxID=3059160 RepID=A0ABP1CT58_9APHY
MMRASRYCSKMPQFPSSAATASSLVFLAIYMLMPPAFPFPPITVFQAHLLAAFFTFSYVGSLYISKNARLRFSSKAVDTSGEMPRTREEEERWRDDPDVIKARLLAASLSTFVDCAAVFLLFWHLDGGRKALIRGSLSGVLIRLGFRSSKDAAEALLPCLTAPALFIGPIYVCFLSSTLPFQSEWSVRGTLLPIIWSWQGWRNYFVGPITEEIVFRACILAVYHAAGASRFKMIFLSPLWFGVAHLHHAWDVYNRYGQTSAALKRAALTTLFQLAYTTLFGFHCAFLFLRTGSLIPPILSHIFCNIMGLPGFGQDLTHFPHRRYPIIIAYILGVGAYVYTITNWTNVKHTMYWPIFNHAAPY